MSIKTMYVHKQYKYQEDDGTDIAFLVPDLSSYKIPWFANVPTYGVADHASKWISQLEVVGYPGEMEDDDYPQMSMKFRPDSNKRDYIRRNRKGNVLYYPEIQTTPGQSGSPIIASYAHAGVQGEFVIGVHTAGDGKTNLGTLNEYFKVSNFVKY